MQHCIQLMITKRNQHDRGGGVINSLTGPGKKCVDIRRGILCRYFTRHKLVVAVSLQQKSGRSVNEVFPRAA